MKKRQRASNSPLFLGIEGGATRSVAILANSAGALISRIQAGPANLRLLSDDQLLHQFRAVAQKVAKPDAIGIGLAGVRTPEDRTRLASLADRIWPKVPCALGADLDTALAAAEPPPSGPLPARVLVLSGTGSCCYGQGRGQTKAKIGGWGHLLGDKASAYDIGLRALKAVLYYYDCDGAWSQLGAELLRSLQLNAPDDLIRWVQSAEKSQVAALALEVFGAWACKDRIATDIIQGAADSLAKDAVSCARRLVKPGTAVQFIFAGGVLLKQPRFSKLVATRLRQRWSEARITLLSRDGAWGGVRMAQALWGNQPSALGHEPAGRTGTGLGFCDRTAPESFEPGPVLVPKAISLSPTERRNPRSNRLDKMPLSDALGLMLKEEAKVPRHLLGAHKQIERAIELITRSFRQGGRLFYVGAGTSGRIGNLDASECPPTFRTPPDQVQAIMAGGQRALWQSIEGAEDDAQGGAQAVAYRGVRRNDIVVGIAASGRTPFVWGALTEAKRRLARTILICFNPHLQIDRRQRPDVLIAVDLGPEILTGSTRLKAGTATKLILNACTTLSMVRLGKVVSNLMVDLNPSNEKLRQRAVRIVRELTKTSESQALQALEKSAWVVKDALRRLR
jgi:N-acetylmuramic acid 6-phosphate etherase